MCDCAEEAERRKREEQTKARGGRGGRGGAGGAGGAAFGGGEGGSGGGVGVFLIRFFGGSAVLVGILALLQKYLNIFGPVIDRYGPYFEVMFGPILEKYGLRKKKGRGNKFLDPNDPDPSRCDGIRLDPSKRRWPVEKPSKGGK